VGPRTYVTKTILPSFQPLTVTSPSNKASHPRMPHTRDLISDNLASSKNFPGPSLFPPRSPTYPSIQVRATTQEAYKGAFGSPIPQPEFLLSPDSIPPSRFFRRPHKDRPLSFPYPRSRLLLYAAVLFVGLTPGPPSTTFAYSTHKTAALPRRQEIHLTYG